MDRDARATAIFRKSPGRDACSLVAAKSALIPDQKGIAPLTRASKNNPEGNALQLDIKSIATYIFQHDKDANSSS